jgi:uncharacterized protein (TIGR02246 family)
MTNRLMVVICAAAISACQSAAGTPGLSSEDIAAIRATTDRWLSAVRSGRWDDAAATFTPDATVWIAGVAYSGRVAIREFHASMPPWNPTRQLHIDEVRGSGAIAYVVGHATVVPEGSTTPVVVSRTLDIRVRQSDGTWLFARDMVSPIPMPTSGPAPIRPAR